MAGKRIIDLDPIAQPIGLTDLFETSQLVGATQTSGKITLQELWDFIISRIVTDDQTGIVGTDITLADTPVSVIGVFRGGQRLTNGVDYTITTNTITLEPSIDPATADELFSIVYFK